MSRVLCGVIILGFRHVVARISSRAVLSGVAVRGVTILDFVNPLSC